MVCQGWVPSSSAACITLRPLMVLGCVRIFESHLRSLGLLQGVNRAALMIIISYEMFTRW